MDFFGDIIAPDFQNTQADIFDNIRTRRGADGKIREIVFVNSASPGVETEYSIFPTELKNKFGNVNYKFLIDNAPLLGIEELNKKRDDLNLSRRNSYNPITSFLYKDFENEEHAVFLFRKRF